MNDSSIVYAFLATLVGCLISVLAGLVAALRQRKSKAALHATISKPKDILSTGQYFFVDALSAGHIKQVSAHQFQYNSASALQFETPAVIHRNEKPAIRFVPVRIQNKSHV